MIPFIRTQVEKFFGRVQNPNYKKLKRILPFQETIQLYNKIYFLGGFEYTEGNYSKFKEASSIKQFLEDVKYDTQKDNVELYFIEEGNGSNYLLTLLDPLELYSSEQILDIVKSPNIKLEDFKSELIYSK